MRAFKVCNKLTLRPSRHWVRLRKIQNLCRFVDQTRLNVAARISKLWHRGLTSEAATTQPCVQTKQVDQLDATVLVTIITAGPLPAATRAGLCPRPPRQQLRPPPPRARPPRAPPPELPQTPQNLSHCTHSNHHRQYFVNAWSILSTPNRTNQHQNRTRFELVLPLSAVLFPPRTDVGGPLLGTARSYTDRLARGVLEAGGSRYSTQIPYSFPYRDMYRSV